MDIRRLGSLEHSFQSATDLTPGLARPTPLSTATTVDAFQMRVPLDGVELAPMSMSTQTLLKGLPQLAPWDPHPNLREFRAEASKTFAHQPVALGTDEPTVNRKVEELIRFLEAKRDHAQTMASGASGERKAFFSDLQTAMEDDLKQLAHWKNMSLAVRTGTYNAIAHEANIEIKYNVNVGYDRKYWSDDELTQLEGALSRIPDHLLFENDIHSFIRTPTIPGGFSGFNVGGNLRIADEAVADGLLSQYPSAAKAGITALTETILHELSHSLQQTPRFKEFSDIAGWRLVGPSGSYRNLPNGGQVKGRDVGITDDPDGDYIIMNQSSRGSYVYRKGAEFGLSDYGRTNPYEDFAETLAEFLIAPEALKAEAPHKYEFMLGFANPHDPLQGLGPLTGKPLGNLMLRG